MSKNQMPRHNHNHKCDYCEIRFAPINNKIKVINGNYIMTNKRGRKKKWIPKKFFKHILEIYEGREIVIMVDIADLGEINEIE
jgi:hypothetical protein